ncbi:hypothetical protein SDC9_90533 [bioreactor metagenome]|uniref:Uncharacterized protein n=1 Tax=bioreactor metagenome TaxID=1076179 RepID=A0A644ZSY0_9ZZZZ
MRVPAGEQQRAPAVAAADLRRDGRCAVLYRHAAPCHACGRLHRLLEDFDQADSSPHQQNGRDADSGDGADRAHGDPVQKSRAVRFVLC